MLRWTLLLCLSLYLTLQIAGEDRGQKRAGLLEATESPSSRAQSEDVTAPAQIAQTPAPEPQESRMVEVVFTPDAPLVTPAPAPAAATEQIGQTMFVAGRSVNVRGGPSTNNRIVGKLQKGEEVLVVWVEGNGWARVRVEGDGIDGYVSASLLTDKAP